MEEDKGNPEPVAEKNRWKLILNVITLVFFVITIALLAYIVYLYYPLKEQMIRDCYSNAKVIGINRNLTGLKLNITP